MTREVESYDVTVKAVNLDGAPTDTGVVPPGLQWRFRDSQLAKVRSEHAAATAGVVGYRENFLVVPLPGKLTEYYTPDEPWDGQFIEMVDPAAFEFVSVVDQIRPRSFPLGRTTVERWNAGVFGSALPNGLGETWYFAARIGDHLRFVVPMSTDQGTGRAGSAEHCVTLSVHVPPRNRARVQERFHSWACQAGSSGVCAMWLV